MDHDTDLVILVRDLNHRQMIYAVSCVKGNYFLGGTISNIKWYKEASKAIWVSKRIKPMRNIDRDRVMIISGQDFRLVWEHNLSGKDILKF